MMYSAEQRQRLLNDLLEKLKKIDIAGAVQIGSGVEGYRDEYSDIDMMIAVNGEVEINKDLVKECLYKMGAVYIKEGMFRHNIYLLIPFFENGMEMDLSIMPTELLSVQSPLWKVIYDKDGNVQKKMDELEKEFVGKKQPYRMTPDIVFEFKYQYRKAMISMRREDYIGALIHLGMMKEYILEVEVLNEKQKAHQFKQYNQLDVTFQRKYLQLFDFEIDKDSINHILIKANELFDEVVSLNDDITLDNEVNRIINWLLE